ncbi:MAG: DUF3592 domain-containing protein [Candidatus Omnitrophica bacterium]|nr:DUF3592 domain-containing protein [Candidatus Omnitrophota bacterium]
MGSVFAVMGMVSWRKANASQSWTSVNGVVESAKVTTLSFRSGKNGLSRSYGVSVVYRYAFNGLEYKGNKVRMMDGTFTNPSSADRFVQHYPPGARVAVFVNPHDPSDAVLKTGESQGEMIFVYLSVAFALSGFLGIGLVMMEARKAQKRKAMAVGVDLNDAISRL